MQWLKHAFGIETAADLSPTPEQIKALDQFCKIVVRKNLIVPVSMFLEMVRPLNYVGSQILHGLSPFVSVWMNSRSLNQMAEFLENRGAIDFLCDRLKKMEEESNKKPLDENSDLTLQEKVVCSSQEKQIRS
jgi:hypothetical protein